MEPPRIVLGPFQVGQVIGRGGMGTVFRAEHARQGAAVAVKVVSAARVRDAQYRAAFQNEVRAVASLDHPTIVMVLDQGIVDGAAAVASRGQLVEGSPYLVMELLDQGSLRERAPSSWSALRRVLLELLDALAHAHARGFVHRDIKPSNVMLASGDGPIVKLTDFGVAHAINEPSAFRGASVTGTPHYMAPEQVRADLRELGPWTDLYAVGCLAFRLASGRPPFFAPGLDTAEVLLRQLESPVPTLESRIVLPPGFADWIETLMAKQPRDRFQRAADAVASLLTLPMTGPSMPNATSAGGENEPTRYLSADSSAVTVPDADVPTVYTVAASSTQVDLQFAPSRHATGHECNVPVASFRTDWRAREAPSRSSQLLGAGLALYGLRPVPMVDRQEERDALWSALAEVHATRRPVVRALRGASGVGKSRLAQWLARRAHEVGAAEILVATHDAAAGAGSGLGPMVAGALRTRGHSRRKAVAFTLEQLRPKGATVEDAAAITELSHPQPPDADPEATLEQEEVRRVRLSTPRERALALTRLLELLSLDRPLLVWLDDVQWGLEALELALHLAELPAGRELPVLVLLTVRDEALEARPLEAQRLASLGSGRTIAVNALAADDHKELVARLVGLSGAVASQVYERTLGNPLFAVHLVGDWVQRGVLVAGDAGFELAAGADATIPDDLHALWLRRLSPMVHQEDGWLVLELAATLGAHVSIDEHRRACEGAEVTPDAGWVSELVLRGLVHEELDGFRFAHGMLVESLVRHCAEGGRSKRAHLACATALAGSRGHGSSERIARHLESAGELVRSLEPMLAASLERAQSSEYERALALLDRWEANADRAALPKDEPRRVRIWIERATILLRRALPKEAAPWIDLAEASVQANDWEEELGADVQHARAKLAQMSGLIHDAISAFERALPLYEARLDHGGVARCQHGLASMMRQGGRREEAIVRFESALENYRRADDQFGLTHCLLGLSDVLIETSRARGLAVLEEARERAEAYGYRMGLAIVHLHLGLAYRYESKFDAAVESFERSAAILDALESTDAYVPRQNIGVIHLIRRDFVAARKVFESTYEAMRDVGRDGFLAFTHTCLLPCYAHAREWSRFDAHCSAADACLERSGVVDIDIELALRTAADLADAAGDAGRAHRARELADVQRRAIDAGG